MVPDRLSQTSPGKAIAQSSAPLQHGAKLKNEPSDATPTGANREPLTKQRITEVALDLLDTYGVEKLSTRKIAEALDIKSASLYHHFANKDELLDQMCSVMFAAALPGPLPEHQNNDWRDWLSTGAQAIRQTALSRRDGAAIMARNRMRSDGARESFTQNMEALKRLGLKTDEAIAVFQSLRCFAVGFALQEQSTAGRTVQTPAQQTAAFQAGLDWFLDGIAARLSHAADTVS